MLQLTFSFICINIFLYLNTLILNNKLVNIISNNVFYYIVLFSITIPTQTLRFREFMTTNKTFFQYMKRVRLLI